MTLQWAVRAFGERPMLGLQALFPAYFQPFTMALPWNGEKGGFVVQSIQQTFANVHSKQSSAPEVTAVFLRVGPSPLL